MSFWKYFFLFLIFIIFFAGYIVQTIVSHEHMHQIIYEKYGINSNVTYNFWGAFRQQATDAILFRDTEFKDIQAWAWVTPDSNTTGKCTENCILSHIQLEISSNQTDDIFFLVFISLLICFIHKEFFNIDYYYEEESK